MNRRGRRTRVVARGGRETRGLSGCRGEPRDGGVGVAVESSGAGLRRRRDDGGRAAEGRKELYGFLEIAGENAQRGATARGRREGEVGTTAQSGGRGVATWFP